MTLAALCCRSVCVRSSTRSEHKMSSDIRKRWKFHLEHGGYCTPPGRAACALRAARVEALLEQAVELGVASVEWVDDDYVAESFDMDAEDVYRKLESGAWTGPFGCIVTVGDESESLWGIVNGPRGLGDPYCRVVVADLASELKNELRQAIGDAEDADMPCSLV